MKPTLAILRRLDELTEADAQRVGGKAYHCAMLRRAGFPVPDGFVVTVCGADSVRPEHLAPYVAAFPTGTLFAVRSSAADEDAPGQSFAGIHRTLLNVPATDLASAVRECFRSVSSEEALAYRRAHGMQESGVMSVLVQEMVHADAAGVAFTVNPVNGSRQEMVINASWGLGEVVVGGLADPDEFLVDRRTLEVRQARLGAKERYLALHHGAPELRETEPERRTVPCLSVDQIAELARLLLRVEAEFGQPQDVEWCLAGGRFYVVQARPITTLHHAPLDIEWSRANALESLPELPSPQVSDTFVRLIDRGLRQLAPEFFAPEDVLGPMARVILGRPYFNFSQFKHMCRLLGLPPEGIIAAQGGELHPEDLEMPRFPLLRRLRALPVALRLAGLWPPMRRVPWSDPREVQRRLDRLRLTDPEALPDAEVLGALALPDQVGRMIGGDIVDKSGFWFGLVRVLCPASGAALERLRDAALAATKTSNSQEALDLLALAHMGKADSKVYAFFAQNDDLSGYEAALQGTPFLERFQRFLQDYGHCSNFDKDWSLPRYREDPTLLLQVLRMHMTSPDAPSPEAIVTKQRDELEAAWRAFNAVAGRRRVLLRPLVRRALASATGYMIRREWGRFENSRVVAELRRWHLVLARRFAERGWTDEPDDYFFLTLDEVAAALQRPEAAVACRGIVATRRAEFQALRDLNMPTVVRESEIPVLERGVTRWVGSLGVDELQGVGVSKGSVCGPVVVIRDPAGFRKMQANAIIVATATDPSWTPLFTLASGVITEIGGTLSHAATLARELGLPAVANVRGATRLLHDGDIVHLDATGGLVRVVARS